MYQPYTYVLGYSISTYTWLFAWAIIAALCGLMLRHRAPRQLMDAGLIGLIFALLTGRAGHILLHHAYFVAHPDEILQLKAGGIDWHFALIGAIVSMTLITRRYARQQHPIRATLNDSFAVMLPLIALAAWQGCAATACAYGAEVAQLNEYPSWLVWEAPDIYGLTYPRYQVQPLGATWALTLLALVLLLHARGWLIGRRFPVILLLFSAGMFALGFLRGDTVNLWAGLRADQWLDLLTALVTMPFIVKMGDDTQKEPLSP